jgi:hypothetical protein
MTTALLDGYPLSANAAASFSVKAGVDPVVETFTMPNDPVIIAHFEKVGDAHIPIDLVLDPGGNSVKFSNLYVTDILPGDDPGDVEIEVADVRVWWKYPHIRRDFNHVRRAGFRRRENWNEALSPQQQVSLETYKYAKFSLTDPLVEGSPPWTAIKALEDIFREVGRKVLQGVGSTFPFDLKGAEKANDIPLEDIVLDDRADLAIARMLGYLPNIDIFIDYDGTLRSYNRLSGDERFAVEAIDPELAQGGHIEVVTSSIVRPQAIEVLFVGEFEVRFDVTESASRTTTVAVGENDRVADNVLPIPDFTADISGITMGQGSYVTYTEYLNYINGKDGQQMTDIDFQQLRQGMIPEAGLVWAGEAIAGQLDISADSDKANWAARIGALQQFYRRMWRVNRRWVDLSSSIKAYLAATIEPRSGQRAPSPAFSDYTIKPSTKAMAINVMREANGQVPLYVGVPSYPSNDIITTGTRPAPAEVTVVDEEQGIIMINYGVDPYGNTDMVFPGLLNGNNIPSASMGTTLLYSIANNAVPGDGVTAAIQVPEFDANFKMSTILTLVPAFPNNNDQYIKKRVEFNQVAGKLGMQGIGANGPVMQIKHDGDTARVAWDDNKAEEIEKKFGLRPGVANLDGMIVNASDGPTVVEENFAPNIDSIAIAVASQVYTEYVDRFQGSAQGFLTEIRPQGWLMEVKHTVDENGEATTQIDLPKSVQAESLASFLPTSMRKVFLKQAQVPK